MKQKKYSRRQKSLAQTKASFGTNKSGSRLLFSEPKKKKTMTQFSPVKRNPQQQSLVWIYFDKNVRDQYHKKTIDNYFQSDISLTKTAINLIPKNTSVVKKNQSFLLRQGRTTDVKRIQSFKNELRNRKRQISRIQLNRQQSSYLPIITQTSIFEKRPTSQHKKIQLIQQTQQIQQLQLATKISQSSKKSISSQQQMQQTFHNSFYETFTKTKPTNKVEKLKRFTNKGMKLYERQLKMEKYQIPLFWKNVHSDDCLGGKKLKCLREQLYVLKQQSGGKQSTFFIHPRSSYYKLFTNNNEGLVDIIVALCKQFIKVKDKVINPKININTIYRPQQKQIIIDSWGASAFQDTLKIRQCSFTSYQNPILGCSKEWLVIPEYLPPQIIRDSMNNWNTKQIWQNSTSCHIWALGILLIQILILIPLWIPYRCSIKNSQKFRRGLLHVKSRTLAQILAKHRAFVTTGIRNALKQTVIPSQKIRPQIFSLINNCLKQDPNERITPQQIISLLQY